MELLCRHVELPVGEIEVPHAQLRAKWLLPAHYVLVDKGRKELVVAIRGTLSVPDVLTDLGAEEVEPFPRWQGGGLRGEADGNRLWI